MKFALVNGQRQEAQPNLSGQCPTCNHPMIAKCGEVNIWHWAHQGKRLCDPWWENETEWHRAWKGQFPVDWQEVVHQADNGEKHIADVKTDRGWVIEFQHSYIKPEERRSRDSFYPKLVWVVNGLRRKRDSMRFLNAWNEGVPVMANSQVRSAFLDSCVLLREWAGSNSPIFFDLGERQVLWWLYAKSKMAYLGYYPRVQFIESHRGPVTELAREFDAFMSSFPKQVADYESQLLAQALRPVATLPLQGYERYFVRRYERGKRRL